MLQPKDCKPALRLKSNFSKYLEQLCTSRSIPEHVTEFWADLQNAEISSITLLKIDSTAEALVAILKILGTLVTKVYGEFCYRWDIGKLELLKRNSTKYIFLGIS